jgi:hypothetical protein
LIKTPKELYEERLKRVEDAINLKVPDKVPTVVHCGYLGPKYVGMTSEEAHYDCERALAGTKKLIQYLQPDLVSSLPQTPGNAFEAIDTKVMQWPGHGISPHSGLQWIEGEYMKADEYDIFLEDPADFAIRVYLPRTTGKLAAFQKIPHLMDMIMAARAGGPILSLLDPEIAAACEAIYTAARENQKWGEAWMATVKEIEEMGFPVSYQMGGHIPFDFLSDYLRGMRGTMLDMYRQPDKLLEAVARLSPMLIRIATSQEKRDRLNMPGMALHRGADGFMSLKQFEKFYWPGLKALILAFVDKGFVPNVFFEGDYTSRLEYLLELPRGKVVCRFDRTDMFKVKEVLGGHHCISGGVLASLLHSGSVQDVKEYCKKLIETVGKDGGYIMSASCSLDDAKPENVKAMVDSTSEFNIYK